MKKTNNIIAFMLIMSFMLTGCGAKKVDTPKLLEPISSNESYRPVEYGDIGDVNVSFGTIVPTDYCHFWTSNVTIKEIMVDIGDYVNSGDVIACADIDAANEEIERLNSELTLENSVFTLNEQKYNYRHQELEYKQSATDIAVLDENHRYDTLLHQYRVNSLNEKIDKQEKIVSDGTLVARASGYVTYVKDISTSGSSGNGDNVVIISDYNDSYIELNDVTVSEEYRRNWMPYDDYYTEIAGNRYELTEYEYAPDELILAESKAKYPNMRMKFTDSKVDVSIGTNIPVFMTGDIVSNVLIVGNDSLYEDNGGTFVYVKKGDSREPRYIEIGKRGNNYTEVVSGLDEGEMVYYSSDSVLPDNYTELEISTSDYSPMRTSETYTIEDSVNKAYYSEYEGHINGINIESDSAVNKGDLICTINTNEGSAVLAEMSNAIADLTVNYNEAENGYSAAIADIEAQMSAIINEAGDESVATSTDASPDVDTDESDGKDENLYQELQLQIEQIKIDEQINTLNYNHELAVKQKEYNKVSCNNDGRGVVYIYAGESGTVSDMKIAENSNVKVGDKLFNIKIQASNKVGLRCEDTLHVNQQVVFYDADSDKQYNGYVAGIGGNTDKVYVTSENGKVYITNNINSSNIRMYYIKLDDESFFDLSGKTTAMYSANEIRDTFVMPQGTIYTETDEKGNSYRYVWRIYDGSLVKQYVTVASDTYNGKVRECVISGLKSGDIVAQEESE